MELRAFAERVLFSDSLESKLERVSESFTDHDPGEARRLVEPVRPENLIFAPRRSAPSMPHPSTLTETRKRATAHHILANHELQALEVMAWVGELPVNCYIWKKSQEFQSVLDYLAGIPLTFEGRNLDHTLEFEEYFEKAGDPKSAAIMKAIHKDEIHHVAFGLKWLRILKPANQSDWDAYQDHLHWPLRPDKSVGDVFHREPRIAAGMTAEFIDRLQPEETSEKTATDKK